MLAPGDVLGDYKILEPLRSGGMASLYLASRRGGAAVARPVAIKVLHAHLARDPEVARLFLDEARLSMRIDHPNVVHVQELGDANGVLFLVMEYVRGCSLAELSASLVGVGRRFTPELAVSVAMQVASGLHAAHETTNDRGDPLGIVHRDVSPQNVLVTSGGHLKVIDFGIAKSVGAERTLTGSLRGKVAYMAPEQASGKRVDRRTDVYALGIVLWELLTMRQLFTARNDFALLAAVRNPKIIRASSLIPDVPPALDEVLGAALCVDPDARPDSAKTFRNLLAEAVPGALSIEASALAELVAEVSDERTAAREAPRGGESSEEMFVLTQPLHSRRLTGNEPILQTLSLVLPAPHADERTVPPTGGRFPKRGVAIGIGLAVAGAAAAGLALSRPAPANSPPAAATPNAPPASTAAFAPSPSPPETPPTPDERPPVPASAIASAAASTSTASNRPPVHAHPRKTVVRPGAEASPRPSASGPSVRIIQGVPIVDPK